MIKKLAVFVLLLGLAIAAAGVFGALHNQVSYSIGPSYFHDLKFKQFAIAPDLHNRLGAAQVGWFASWWMGAVIGLPPFVVGIFRMRDARAYWIAGLRAIGLAIIFTTVAALIGLGFGLAFIDAEVAAKLPVPSYATAPVEFLQAGLMHDLSYLGGVLGILAGLVAMWRAARGERP